tara:strand:- start:2417 stop:5353 length:2937 start_codon:yes stop_codon:yes gene_type:complete
MPTLVYKLKFEIDKSSIKGLDKIVSKDLAANLKQSTSQVKKLGDATTKTSSTSKKFRKEVQDVTRAQDQLIAKTGNTIQKLKEASNQFGLGSRQASKQRRELRSLADQTQQVNNVFTHQISRYKLTSEELIHLNKRQETNSKLSERQQAAIKKNAQALALEKQKLKELNQARKEATALLDRQNRETLEQSQAVNQAVRSANKFAESQDRLNREFKESINNLGANNRVTAQKNIESKKSVSAIDQEINSIKQLINAGNINDSQKEKSQITLNRLTATRERAIANVRRYRLALKTSASASAAATVADQRRAASMGRTNKAVSIGNQLAFSFGDLINDASQFNFGFATGMRAVGNNIGFTAEMFMLLNMQAKLNGMTLGALVSSSLTPLTIGLLGLNTAVSLVTVVSQRLEAAAKKTSIELEEFLGAVKKLKQESEGFEFLDENALRSNIETLQSFEPLFDEIIQKEKEIKEAADPLVVAVPIRRLRNELKGLAEEFGFNVKEAKDAKKELELFQKRLEKIETLKGRTELALLQETISKTALSFQNTFELGFLGRFKGEFQVLEEGAAHFFRLARAAKNGSDEQALFLAQARKLDEELQKQIELRDKTIDATKVAQEEAKEFFDEQSVEVGEKRAEEEEKRLKKEAKDFVESYQERFEDAKIQAKKFFPFIGEKMFEMLNREKIGMLISNEFVAGEFDKILGLEEEFHKNRKKILSDDPSSTIGDSDNERDLQMAFAIQQLMFDTELVGLSDHEQEKLQIGKRFDDMRLDFLRQGFKSVALMRAIDEAEHAELEQLKLDKTKDTEEKRREVIGAALDFAGQASGAIGSLVQKEISNEIKAAKARKASAAEIDALNRKKFRSNKAFMLANAVINTAEAVTAHLDKNPILAAAIGALGAIQIATIARTKYESAAPSGSSVGTVSGLNSETQNTPPTQQITFMPTAENSNQTNVFQIENVIDRAGFATFVNQGQQEIRNNSVSI